MNMILRKKLLSKNVEKSRDKLKQIFAIELDKNGNFLEGPPLIYGND